MFCTCVFATTPGPLELFFCTSFIEWM